MEAGTGRGVSAIILIGGGVRSGKSAFAVARARVLGERRAFVATAQAFDDEMRARIEDHRREREEAFTTFEEPLAIASVLSGLDAFDVAVVDCLTLWLSNMLLEGMGAAAIAARVDELVTVLRARPLPTLLISNEVGMGIVPETPLGRAFRDLSGRMHQAVAAAADEVYVAMMGVVLRLRPGPVDVARAHAGDGR
jgi:adenosylcobinamide kinase/adenosylcobinamide-phosphate guanylyltransferase